MFGGKLSTASAGNQTWIWGGTNWQLRAPSVVPGPRDVPTAAFDRLRGVVVMFGGGQSGTWTPNAETWLWDGTNWALYTAQPPSVLTPMLDQVVTAGQTARLTVNAMGDAPLSYQWSFNGTPIEGANASTLTLTNVNCSQMGLYSVSVTNTLGNVSGSLKVSVLGIGMYAGLSLCGETGAQFRIDWAPAVGNTNDWQTATNVTVGSSPYFWVDMDSPFQPRRFYRAIPQP
jgi:hypothetical protein